MGNASPRNSKASPLEPRVLGSLVRLGRALDERIADEALSWTPDLAYDGASQCWIRPRFILRRRICGPCIAENFNETVNAIETALRRSGSLTLLKITPEPCDVCGNVGTIFSVPADA